ncbi:MAG: SIS domain-containing protein [Bellilinea sp.]
MIQSPYITDILDQPEVLQKALLNYPAGALSRASRQLKDAEFDRILITGMGASYMAAIPAAEILSQSGVPVLWLETADLLHYRMAQITPRTLLWVVSQSGYSIEIVRLLEALAARPPAFLLGTTNNLASPLAKTSRVTLPLSAGDEFTVSTKTYSATLAMTQLAALELMGQPLDAPMAELRSAADAGQAYLTNLPQHVQELKDNLGQRFARSVIVGRGRSLAAVMNGSLILKEAAKVIIEGMSAAHFRHGPLELADEHLTVLMLAGDQPTADINRGLAQDVTRFGGQVYWIGNQPEPTLAALRLPQMGELGLPLLEILPLQMMTIAFGELNGVQPGIFRHIGKVTQTE